MDYRTMMTPQPDGLSCGVSVTQAVLRWLGVDRNYNTVRGWLRCDDVLPSCIGGLSPMFEKLIGKRRADALRGVTPWAMREVLSRFGIFMRPLSPCTKVWLQRELKLGPVVGLMDGISHWVLLVNYDDDGFYILDPCIEDPDCHRFSPYSENLNLSVAFTLTELPLTQIAFTAKLVTEIACNL